MHPQVLRALTMPVIGQFDPVFTGYMDDVMQLARQVLVTRNARCFPVSGLAAAGLEAVLNSLIEPGDGVAVDGPPAYRSDVAEIARRYGAEIGGGKPKVMVVPHGDPETGRIRPLSKPEGPVLVVDATMTLGGVELRTDDWGLDVVVAGVDACIGAASGLALVTYTDQVESIMQRRAKPPPTSYLDLLQLQAYWSAERLNHHTAPTSLVYALREALRLIVDEGLEARWRRHARVGAALHAGLSSLGLESDGDGPFAVVSPPNANSARQQLRDEYGVDAPLTSNGAWRLGLFGADAELPRCLQVLAAIAQVMAGGQHVVSVGAARAAAIEAYEAA
jgi:(S)-ureidoglycine-glyoxylate aminotransferase